MICSHCGKQLPSDLTHCPNCGNPVFSDSLSSDGAPASNHLCTVACVIAFLTLPILYLISALCGDTSVVLSSVSPFGSLLSVFFVPGYIILVLWVVYFFLVLSVLVLFVLSKTRRLFVQIATALLFIFNITVTPLFLLILYAINSSVM